MANECEEYVNEKMKIVPRFLKPICQVHPEAAKRFADFYETIFGDGALDRKTKELIFTAIGVATASPRCIVHVIPAIEAGATDEEILEAVAVGFVGAGFYPNNPGIPYCFEYAAKTLEVAQKYRKGEDWEYLEPPVFRG
ncbi:carboxymuconolactone decarboxylase family protein [Candidatus Pyrohabitans sp.]